MFQSKHTSFLCATEQKKHDRGNQHEEKNLGGILRREAEYGKVRVVFGSKRHLFACVDTKKETKRRCKTRHQNDLQKNKCRLK